MLDFNLKWHSVLHRYTFCKMSWQFQLILIIFSKASPQGGEHWPANQHRWPIVSYSDSADF